MLVRGSVYIAWLLCGAVLEGSDAITFEPRDGVLVLRNGYVLSGRITPLGESYLVSLADGGEARVPRTEVDFDCRNLEEAYRIKRDTLESDETKSHLRLAEWCLRHGLNARAADQLLVVRLRDPRNPLLAAYERRLEARVVTSAPLAQSPPTAPPKPLPGAAESVELESFLVKEFTTTIQPILLSRCANYSCHGGGATPYRLVRPSMGQAATSRLTHRNLQATLVYVDRDDPAKSRLIHRAQEPHGAVVTAAFNEKTGNQLELLAGWVRRLGMTFPDPSPENDADARRTSGRVEAARPVGTNRHELPPEQPQPASFESDAGSLPPGKDPFDPEVFNRKYHPQRTP